MEISHKEYITILKEKNKYERMKDILRSENEKYMANNNSCKAAYKIKDLKLLNAFFKKQLFNVRVQLTLVTPQRIKMESYRLKCKKNTENIDPEISSTSNGSVMILSKCAICGSKKSRFIKK